MVGKILDGISDKLRNLRFKKITEADRAQLRHTDKYSPEWWELNKHWIKRYGYSLRVQLIFDFIELLIVPSGKGKGGTFKLDWFEKIFIVAAYGPVDSKLTRIVRRAILSIARKNGKTALAACLVLTHLVGPERVENGEVYSAANEREQAAIVFKYAAQIVRADPELEAEVKIIDSTKTMVAYRTGSFYRAISAEAGSKYGYNPTVVIFDELAQAKNRELYDALDTSMGARTGEGEEPLFIVISTQSKDPQHILSQLIDDGVSMKDPSTVCHLYAVPDDAGDEIFTDKEVWKLANPALGGFRSLSEMKTAAGRAKRMPTFEASFRNLYLNQRVDAKSPLIPRAEWFGCKGDTTLGPETGLYLALDLSGKTDLTTLTGISDGEKDIVRCWFWKPEDSIDEHEKRDRVPYKTWVNMGVLETTPGRAVQYDWVAERILKIKQDYEILGIAFDRWAIDAFVNACQRVGLDVYIEGKDDPISGAIRLVPWGQGFKDMSPAVDALEVSVLERKLIHDGHPVLTWNISNAMAISDPAGNKKLDKSKSRFRIDGAVALAMSLGLKGRTKKEPDTGKSFWETMDVD